MNWRQRFGVVFFGLSLLCAGATWGTQRRDSRLPVPADELGLAKDHAVQAAPIAAAEPVFQIVGAPQDNANKNVRLWEATTAVLGHHTPNYRQEIGDCVSFGVKNAGEYLQCFQINETGLGEFHPLFPPFPYGYSRVDIGNGRIRGDGSVGAWGARSAKEGGNLRADHEQCPEYRGSVARDWGRNGPPQWAKDAAKDFTVETIAQVRTAAQVRDAICNGYPVTIASNFGTQSIKPKDGRNVARWNDTWYHQMCVVGYDGTAASGEKYFYVLNSWGEDAHPEPLQGEPPGGFWVVERDMDKIAGQDDSWAFSTFDGFPAKELDRDDFDVFGERVAVVAANQEQGDVVMLPEFEPAVGYGISAAFFVLCVICFVWGRLGNVRTLATMLLAMLAGEVLNAAENALNFGIVGGVTATDECPFSFGIVGGVGADEEEDTPEIKLDILSQCGQCKCGPDCDCVNCDCGCDKHIAGEPPPRRTQWLYFTADWCVNCPKTSADFRPWLERAGWEVSPTEQAHVRIVDADLHADLMKAHRVTLLPTFVLIADGKEVERHSGYPGRDKLASEYIAAAKSLPAEPNKAPPPPKEMAAPNSRVELRQEKRFP